MANPSAATLLIGGVLFVATFLILQMTKWGQENPVAKCVALSVFAHVVLLVYAYTTNLITHVPVIRSVEPVPIRLAENHLPEPADDQHRPSEDTPFWERFSDDPSETLVEAPSLAPLETDAITTPAVVTPDLKDVVGPTEPSEWNSPDLNPVVSKTIDQALNRSLQPRHPDTEPLPAKAAVETSQALPSVTHENQLRSPQRSREVKDPSQWLSEQLNANAPQRVEAEDPDLDWGTEQSQAELAEKLQQQWAQQLPTAAGATSQRPWQQLIENAGKQGRQRDPLIDTQQTRPDNPLALPRNPMNQEDYSNTRRRLGDGQPLPARYARRQQHSQEWLKQQGGSDETEAAIARGLAYLASIQQPDGSWNPRQTDAGRELQVLGHNRQGAGAQADTAITGLAILAFLGAGNTHLEGPYREQVRRGLEYLMARQHRSGSLAGPSQFFAQMYCHSMALLALSEASSLTGDQRLEEAVKQGVAYSVQAQNQTIGGWRYQPGDSGDMSQFGWQVMALNSAALNGQRLDDKTLGLMKSFLQRHTQGQASGLAHYRYGEDISPVMTAEAMFCRYLLQVPITEAAAEEAAQEILGNRLADKTGKNLPGRAVDNVYFWYYGTLALHQMAIQPAFAKNATIQNAWQQWNTELKSRLLTLQESATSDQAGSWDSKWFMWGCYGGRVYATAMSTMCLQVYYRYDLEAEDRLRTAGVPDGPLYRPTTEDTGAPGLQMPLHQPGDYQR